MLDFKIWSTLPNEKSDKAKVKNCLHLPFYVNNVDYNILMSTRVSEEAEMKSISLGEGDFLGEEKKSDKFVLMIRGLMLTWSCTVLF